MAPVRTELGSARDAEKSEETVHRSRNEKSVKRVNIPYFHACKHYKAETLIHTIPCLHPGVIELEPPGIDLDGTITGGDDEAIPWVDCDNGTISAADVEDGDISAESDD